jgi:hypothetical protein
MLVSRFVAMRCLGMEKAYVRELFPGAVGPAHVLNKVLKLPETLDCIFGKDLDWFTANISAGTSRLPPLGPHGTVYLPVSHSHKVFDARVQIDSILFVLQFKSVVSCNYSSKKTWGPDLERFKAEVDVVQAALPAGMQAIGVWVTMKSASYPAITFARVSENVLLVDAGVADEFLGAVAHRWTDRKL